MNNIGDEKIDMGILLSEIQKLNEKVNKQNSMIQKLENDKTEQYTRRYTNERRLW